MNALCADTGHDAADPYAESVDPRVRCTDCEAVCCRLTVVLMPEDRIPEWLTEVDESGLTVMARGEDGWCRALDARNMHCGIYEQRPEICRSFAMGGPYCRDERERWRGHEPRAIDALLIA